MPQTAFVFIYLPGQVRPTVAGRFTWHSETTPHLGELVYGTTYLANAQAIPLDPVALPLREQLFRTTLSQGFFGVLRDAVPDDWGRHVASRLYGDRFQTPFDYLWLPAPDRMGALAFGRTSERPEDEKPLLPWEELETSVYLEAIQKLDRNIPLTAKEQEVAVLLGAGTTAGGARPKFSTIKGNAVWLAKLNRHGDRFNEVRVEAAMLDLAAACGISVPEHDVQRIHEQDVLLVKRFDRTITDAGILRHRMVSAATVLQSDEAAARLPFTGSYLRLARELARWTVTADEDRRQLFRRVAFNALTSTTDDHERNHALLAEKMHYRLSPAFDLVPQPSGTRRRFLALVAGDYGALAIRENLLSRADLFQLTRERADEVINEIQATVRQQWRTMLTNRDVNGTDVDRISGCFDPQAFEESAPEQR